MSQDFKVKDINQADFGRKEISIAETEMPGLMSLRKEFQGKNFAEFKDKLSTLLAEKIGPISKEIKKLLKDEKYLDGILLEGSRKADEIASKKIKEMKKLLGF